MWLSRKAVQENDKSQEQMLEQHLYLGKKKKKGCRGYKLEKARGIEGEQRFFTKAKEWSLKGFCGKLLFIKWKWTIINYIIYFF